jgi:hypothetical protein
MAITKEEFHSKFKEELNIRYQNAALKWEKDADLYQQGIADGIDISETIFNSLWRRYEENQ